MHTQVPSRSGDDPGVFDANFYAVAHEIKNPLTPMKLAIQHLQHAYRNRKEGFEEVLEDVAATVTTGQIEALSRIASEFSHFGSMPRRQVSPCDITVLVSDALRLFSAETGVRFDVQLAPGLPSVSADGEELRRAFINIIRNGVQAMEGRGTLEVRTAAHASGVKITFRDFGPGIPEHLRDRLFQPKVSTKPDGMGLGLVIVKKTVDDLGGSIVVENAT